MAYNGPGAPGAPLQRTTYTLGDNISSIVLRAAGYDRLERPVGSGRVVGFVIKLDSPIEASSSSGVDRNYVIFTSEQMINNWDIYNVLVGRMSGGRYKKSRKTRKMRKSRGRKH